MLMMTLMNVYFVSKQMNAEHTVCTSPVSC